MKVKLIIKAEAMRNTDKEKALPSSLINTQV